MKAHTRQPNRKMALSQEWEDSGVNSPQKSTFKHQKASTQKMYKLEVKTYEGEKRSSKTGYTF